MRTNYMMTVDDVMEELGVKRSKAYSILKQLNDASEQNMLYCVSLLILP